MQKCDFDILVAYAPIRCYDINIPLHPSERYDEIIRCKNEKVKQEKYLVWKLLEQVVTKYINLDFANLKFTKTDNGQWVCPDFYFSLSHTDGLVCVAVCKHSVGVDAEPLQRVSERLATRILTARELSDYRELSPCDKNRFLLCAWVKKESIFKKSGGEKLLPGSIEISEHHTELKCVEVEGREYVISVSGNYGDKIEFKYVEEI